jgi:hypothetical protein
VDEIEREAQELARRQIEEEENRQFYFEHREELDQEYLMLLEMNSSSNKTDIQSLLHAWNLNIRILKCWQLISGMGGRF